MEFNSKKKYTIIGLLSFIISFVFFVFYSIFLNIIDFTITDIFSILFVQENFTNLLISIIFCVLWLSFLVISGILLPIANEKLYKIISGFYLLISSLLFFNSLVLLLVHFIAFLSTIFIYSNKLEFKKSYSKVKVYFLVFIILISLFSFVYSFNNKDLMENALVDGISSIIDSDIIEDDQIFDMISSDDREELLNQQMENLPDGFSEEDLQYFIDGDFGEMEEEVNRDIIEQGQLDEEKLNEVIEDVVMNNNLIETIIQFLPFFIAFLVFGFLMFYFVFVKIFTFILAGLIYLCLKKFIFNEEKNNPEGNIDPELNNNNNNNNNPVENPTNVED